MTKRSKRSILLLDARYPVEHEVLRILQTVPDGDKGSFLRGLILIGFEQYRKARDQASAPKG